MYRQCVSEDMTGRRRPRLEVAVATLEPHEVHAYNYAHLSALEPSRGDFAPQRHQTELLRGVFPAGFTAPRRGVPPSLRPELARLLSQVSLIKRSASSQPQKPPTITSPRPDKQRELPRTQGAPRETDEPIRSSFSFPAHRVTIDHEGYVRPFQRDQLSALPPRVYHAPLPATAEEDEEERGAQRQPGGVEGLSPARRKKKASSCSRIGNFPLYLQSIEARRQQLQHQAPPGPDELGPSPSRLSEQSSVMSCGSTLLPPVIPICSPISARPPNASPSFLQRAGTPNGQLTETDSVDDSSSTGSNRTPFFPASSTITTTTAAAADPDVSADLLAQLRGTALHMPHSPGGNNRAAPSTLRKDFHGLTRKGLWPTLSPKSSASQSPKASPRRKSPVRVAGGSTTASPVRPAISLVCTGTTTASSPRAAVVEEQASPSSSSSWPLSLGSVAEDEVIAVSVLPTAEVQHGYCGGEAAGGRAPGEEVKVKISGATTLEAFRETVWAAIGARRVAVLEGAFSLHAYLPTSNRIVRLAHEAMWRSVLRDAMTVAGCHRLLVMVELSRTAIQSELASASRCYMRTNPPARKAADLPIVIAGVQDGEGRRPAMVVGELAEQREGSGTGEATLPVESPPRGRAEDKAPASVVTTASSSSCNKKLLLYAQLTSAMGEPGGASSSRSVGKTTSGMTGLRLAPRIFTEELKAFCFDRFLNEFSPRRRRRARTHTFRSQCTSPGRKHAVVSPTSSPKAAVKAKEGSTWSSR